MSLTISYHSAFPGCDYKQQTRKTTWASIGKTLTRNRQQQLAQ